MLEKLFDRSFMVLFIVMFFVCSVAYNVAYFATLGDSMWYFFYIPSSIFDIIKTGLMMLLPLIIVLIIFKPILVNPAFTGNFPSGTVLLIMAALVLASNFLYVLVSPNLQNKSLVLAFEILFYIAALVCFIAIVYYFSADKSPQFLMIIFLLSLIPTAFLIGVADAKISVNAVYSETKSQILLSSDKVISAKILRSFDKGMLMMVNVSSVNFVAWDGIKEVKFKRVGSF